MNKNNYEYSMEGYLCNFGINEYQSCCLVNMLNMTTIIITLYNSWQSVFRMTIGGDNAEYGDRIATVFFKSELGVMISSAVSEDKNFRESFKDELKEGKWNNIVISQEFEELKLMYKVTLYF